MDDRQTSLDFGVEKPDRSLEEGTAQEEWERGGLPEYKNPQNDEFCMIKIRFANEGDLNEFAELIGQKLTPKTKSIWHPFKSHWGKFVHRFIDESNDPR